MLARRLACSLTCWQVWLLACWQSCRQNLPSSVVKRRRVFRAKRFPPRCLGGGARPQGKGGSDGGILRFPKHREDSRGRPLDALYFLTVGRPSEQKATTERGEHPLGQAAHFLPAVPDGPMPQRHEGTERRRCVLPSGCGLGCAGRACRLAGQTVAIDLLRKQRRVSEIR